jgi:hypothetical protein
MKQNTKKYKKEDLVNKIIDLRIKQGYSVLMIIEFVVSQGLSSRTAYNLLEESRSKIASYSEKDHMKALEDSINRFENLYADAIKENNKKEARELLKEISKLKGLYTEKVDVSGKIEHSIDVIKLISVKKNEEE